MTNNTSVNDVVDDFDSRPVVRVATLDYLSFVKLSYESCVVFKSRYYADVAEKNVGNYSFPTSFFDDIRTFCHIKTVDLVAVILLAVFWTYLRIYLTNNYFLPCATKFGIPVKIRKKVPESCWKFMFYSFAWSWSAYVILLSGRRQYFWDPLSVWDGWHTGMPIPIDIQFAYLIQSSFYLHSIYGTVFLDVWRKDSLVMLAHHFLTIVLIVFSFAARYHDIGALVLFLHDISDVALEFTKLNVYMKDRNGKYHVEHDILSSVGFLLFAVSWYIFRLYWFPLKVLYASLYGAVRLGPKDIPFVPVFNTMLWILLAMNCYWFSFILLLLVRVVTGQMKEIDDTREFEDDKTKDDEEKIKQKKCDDERNGAVVVPSTTTTGATNKEEERNNSTTNNKNNFQQNGIAPREHTSTIESKLLT